MKKLLCTLLFVLPLSLLTQVCSAQYYNLHSFGNGSDGIGPNGSLIQSGNKLYGMTYVGGGNTDGNIFSINLNGTGYTNLFAFNGTNGSNPNGSLLLVGGVLYGMTLNGGVNNYGVIFSIDTNGTHFRVLWDFSLGGTTNGSHPYGDLIISGGVLYGMTNQGGVNSYGNVFSIDTNGTHYTDRWDFNASGGTNGTYPYGSLTLLGKKLFGMTSTGGVNNAGNVFSIDTNGTHYTDRYNFNTGATNGRMPRGNLTFTTGKFYGMTSLGGLNNDGIVFSMDSNGNGFRDRWNFDNGGDTNGSNPYGSFILKGKTLFGMTMGGIHNVGNIFGIDTDGTKYKDIEDFNNTNGADPNGSLIYWGGSFYGMTEAGGLYSSSGVVFNDTIIKLTLTDTNITCNGSNNGHITAHLSGIATPYTYSWTGGSTKDKITGLSAGTYTVTVTDNDGIALTASVNISQPPVLAITMGASTNPLCNGDNGTATANAPTGGTPNYTYNWTPSGGTNLTANLTAGTYTVTATDKQGCTATASVTITEPSPITAIPYSVQDDGSGDGVAAVTASGGVGPYSYSWNPSGKTTDTIKGLHPRSYCCTITDHNMCTDTVCITITSDLGVHNLVSNAGQVTIYPNPNNGLFTVQSSVFSGQSTVEIYNVLGEEVYSKTSVIKSQLSVNLSNQPEGIYLYRIVAEDGNLVGEGKLIIQK